MEEKGLRHSALQMIQFPLLLVENNRSTHKKLRENLLSFFANLYSINWPVCRTTLLLFNTQFLGIFFVYKGIPLQTQCRKL